MLATTGPLVLLLAAGSAGGLLEGHVGAGGGYQGNVTLATAGSPVSGSGIATAWAALGLGWDPGDSTSLHGGLRYDGAFYPGATDLTRNAGSVDLLWIQAVGSGIAVIVAASGAWAWYADPARSGPGLSLRATLRAKPWTWLTLRGGYAYTQRWAEVTAYSTSSNAVLASAEARLASGIYLGLGYSWLTGPQTFYAEAPATGTVTPAASGPPDGSGGGPGGGGSGGGMATGSGVFTDLVPYLANATESTLAPSFEAVVWEGLYLFATYAYTWGSSTEGSYTVQYALGGAGYRF